MLSGPVHTKGERPKGGGGETCYLLPVLALHAGARYGELLQLFASDVRKEAGILYLDFNSEGSKHLKTDTSHRRVPLHPELVRLGFLKYVEQQREAGSGARLFPSLRASVQGVLTSRFSKWLSPYGQSLIAPSPGVRKTFHSFRHGFKDACREAGVPEDVRDQLCGHKNPTVGRGYGSGHSFKMLAAWVSKISYPGVAIQPWKPAGGKATAKLTAENLGIVKQVDGAFAEAKKKGTDDMTPEEVRHLLDKMKDPVGVTLEAGE